MGVSKILLKGSSYLSHSPALSCAHVGTHVCKKKKKEKKRNPLIILAFSNFLSVPHSPSHHFSTHLIISSKCVISRGNNMIFTTNLTSEIFLIFFSCELSESYYREHSPWPVKIFPDKSASEYLCTKVSPRSCLVSHFRSDGDQNYIYLTCWWGRKWRPRF